MNRLKHTVGLRALSSKKLETYLIRSIHKNAAVKQATPEWRTVGYSASQIWQMQLTTRQKTTEGLMKKREQTSSSFASSTGQTRYTSAAILPI
jgi:hypothetical protein